MPLTAVVFDVGNVLYHWDPRNLYRQLIGDEAALERCRRAANKAGESVRCTVRIGPEEQR